MSHNLPTATYFMDYDHEIVKEFITNNSSPEKSKEERTIELYYAVRDSIRYDPYTYSFEKATSKHHMLSMLVGRGVYQSRSCLLLVAERLGYLPNWVSRM